MERKSWMLWDLSRGQRWRYAAGFGVMCCAIVFMYLGPLVTRGAIDGLLDKPKSAAEPNWVVRLINAVAGEHAGAGWKLAMAGGLVLAVMALHSLLTFVRGWLTSSASETISQDLRKRLYDHLQHAPCSYHDKAQTGDLVQRCTSDVDTVRQFFSSQVIEVQRAVVLIIIVVPMLLWLDWRQALIALSLVPVMIAFAVIFFGKVRSSFKEMDEAEGAMTSVLQENLTGIRVVRAFARHDFEKGKFQAKNAKHRDLNYRMIRLMAFYWSLADLLVFMQMALVMLTGATRVAHGTMTVGDLVAFQVCVGMYVWPLRQMGRVVAELGKASISAGRIREILEQPRESGMEGSGFGVQGSTEGSGFRVQGSVSDPSSPNPEPRTLNPRSTAGRIDIENLSFSHGGKQVLDGVTLSIEPGETLAILGPSGSGKSTLIHLLLRLYDYDSGSIRLDGRELKDLDRKFVRRQFGVVMQEPFLYSKTLRDNIRLGRHEAGDDQIVLAARAACIHESIEGFEKDYDTMVGEKGVTLSGGQRQRVAIARALLMESPILVLDDALSAVDTRTETQIRDALRGRRGRQTTLLIAHRLSTLMHADRIIVLENGRITQCGSHEDLATTDGLYRRLWQIQGELEDDLRSEMEEEETADEAAEPDGDVATVRS